MRKLMLALSAIALVFGAQAASVDWAVAGTSAQEGYTVYLLTSVADSYESVDALAAASVGSATITKSGRQYTTGAQTSYGAAVTPSSSFYFAIVSSDSATSFNYVDASSMAASVYDPDNQESSPGTFTNIGAAAIAGGTSGAFAPVPEPTSGLLMLLGLAGLALRRKRA